MKVYLTRGRYTDHVKVVISQGQVVNLHKIGKYGKEIGEKLRKMINEIEENRNFYIVTIDSASAPDLIKQKVGEQKAIIF